MSKKKEAAPERIQGGEVQAPIDQDDGEFRLGEPAIFRTADGAGITVKIIRAPRPEKPKFSVQFPDGTIVPVEPRLIEKK